MTAIGAGGGGSTSAAGGSGSSTTATFPVTADGTYSVLVGSRGQPGTSGLTGAAGGLVIGAPVGGSGGNGLTSGAPGVPGRAGGGGGGYTRITGSGVLLYGGGGGGAGGGVSGNGFGGLGGSNGGDGGDAAGANGTGGTGGGNGVAIHAGTTGGSATVFGGSGAGGGGGYTSGLGGTSGTTGGSTGGGGGGGGTSAWGGAAVSPVNTSAPGPDQNGSASIFFVNPITSSLAPAKVGQAYSQTLTADTAVTWTLVGGVLPTGISLTPAGVLAGTPSTTAAASLTFKATAANGAATTTNLTMGVSEGLATAGLSGVPRKIKRSGYTTLLKRAATTNSGARVNVRVIGKRHPRGYRIVTKSNGKVQIRTFGKKLKLRVIYSAPSANGYGAFSVVRNYRT